MKWLVLALFNAVMMMSLNAQAQLVIEITQGVDDPTAIAVVPFAWQGTGTAPEDIAAVVQGDLRRSGQFSPVSRSDMLGMPSVKKEIFYRDWRAIETEYLLIGRVSVTDQMRIEYELYDVLRQATVYEGVEQGSVNEARMLAHRVSDQVYQALTGIRGAFATRLLYVAVTRVPGGKDYYRLTLSDSDGARPIVLLESREPVLAPAWSPDGNQIAYVSFESSPARHLPAEPADRSPGATDQFSRP